MTRFGCIKICSKLKNNFVVLLVFIFLFSLLAPPYAEASFWQERRKAISEHKSRNNPSQLASAKLTSFSSLPTQVPLMNQLPGISSSPSLLYKEGGQKRKRNPILNQASLQIPELVLEKIAGLGTLERVYLSQGQKLSMSHGKLITQKPLVIHI